MIRDRKPRSATSTFTQLQSSVYILPPAAVTGLRSNQNQSIFYFISVHIEVILDKNKKQKPIIIIYINFPTGLRTIDLTILVITSLLYRSPKTVS